MNRLEREMKDLLVKGRQEFGWVAVKAEFEAEGTRLDELLRLVEIAHRADVDIAVKIGGCEALMDLFQAKLIGVDFVVAPMIETAYALSKFEAAIGKAFSAEEESECEFLWNIETITGFEHLDSLVELGAASQHLDGMVFGRSDFCGSMKVSPDSVNTGDIQRKVEAVASACAQADLDLVVGGGVSIDSLAFLRAVRSIHLTRFETRKIVMGAEALDLPTIEEGLLAALQFELKWLTNKRDYYSSIYNEDEKRFLTLRNRWNVDV